MVSVIIPAYNYAKFLPDALNSLLYQSFSDWECIIVNNGSFDNTEEVSQGFLKNDKRFKYFSIENKGVSNSRNFALKHARGEFIQFLDADDEMEKEKLTTHTEYLKHHKEIDLVYGNARYFTTENKSLRKFSMHESDLDWMPRISGRGIVLVNAFLKRNIFPINAPLFRKSLIEKNGDFDEALSGLEDWDLWLRFAVEGANFKFVEGADTYALIRIHPESASQNKKMMHAHILPVLQHYLLHAKTIIPQKIYLYMRYQEELLDACFLIISGRYIKIIASKSNSVFSFIILLLSGVFFLPLYLVLKIYRKLFQSV